MIHIFTDINKIGGTETWLNNIVKYFQLLNIKYEIVRDINNINFKDIKTIILNNFRDDLTTLLENNNLLKIYFVIHSEICPMNMFLIKYLKYINDIIFISKIIFDKLEQKLNKLKDSFKYHIIENFVENIVENNNFIKNKNIYEKKIFNYIGRISEEKNIPMMLYAFSKLDKSKWILNIYGSTNDKRYECIIKNIIKSLNFCNNVIMHGFVKEKNILYLNCDYIILPSISEGSSYAIIEALSYSVPVIAIKNVGDNNKIIDDYNGYLIDIDCFIDTDKIYLNNYNEILKKVGYVEAVLNYDYDGDGYIHFNPKRIMIPPNLYNLKLEIFDNNIEKFEKVLKSALLKNLIFDKTDYNVNYIIKKIEFIFV
jgi:glycosyltransferase involved in cell wall biosynthesis